jgi:hypothetical protein
MIRVNIAKKNLNQFMIFSTFSNILCSVIFTFIFSTLGHSMFSYFTLSHSTFGHFLHSVYILSFNVQYF